MKKIKVYIRGSILILFLLSIFPTGCMELEEEPLGFASPDNYFNSISQAEAVLTGTMNQLWEYWWNEGYSWGWVYFVYDDQIEGGDLNIPYNHGQDLWSAHYKNILNLNTLLKAVKAGRIKNATPDEIDALIGQAKLLRAFNYFQLVRLFGEVPLYTDEMEDPAISPIARTPIAEVYTLIVSDFTEAAAKLPATWPEDKKGRPTSGVAKALLAKAYLTMATAPLNETDNYAKARDAAAEVMDDEIYDLLDSINEVFLLENKYSKEMMWSFNSNYNDVAVEAQIWTPWQLGGWSNVSADPRMDTLWPPQPRKDAYLLTVIDGKKYDEIGAVPTCRKWIPPNIPQSDYDNYTNVVNCPIMRYADVLLMYAEAANMANGGPTQEACDAVNRIVDRANGYVNNPGHPRFTTAMSQEEFDDAVIMERNWELCFEYDRWFDLCRKRILDKVSQRYIQNFSDDDYLWPIPEIDLRLNPLLKQNPGYPSPTQ